MAEFAGDEWFANLNATLAAAGPVPLADGVTLRVVVELADAPSKVPHAFTLSLRAAGASAEVGDHLAADTLVRLAYADAARLLRGELDSATALREGRVKVRGDVNGLVALLDWLLAAHRPRA